MAPVNLTATRFDSQAFVYHACSNVGGGQRQVITRPHRNLFQRLDSKRAVLLQTSSAWDSQKFQKTTQHLSH
eukprot:5692998-Amphidinium_carterae.1